MLRTRDVITPKAAARVREITHKYGAQAPRNIKEADELCRANVSIEYDRRG